MASRAFMEPPAQLASAGRDLTTNSTAVYPSPACSNLRMGPARVVASSATASAVLQQRLVETKRPLPLAPPSAPPSPFPPSPFLAPAESPSPFDYEKNDLFLRPREEPPQGDWNTRLLFGRAAKTPDGGVKDVNKDTFWPAVQAAGDKLVVLDMYSRWCGPCRLIYPKLMKLSDMYSDVVFLKMDCVPENKALATELGIGILPTFKILKGNEVVSEVKGAKYDELVRKIEKARAVPAPQLVKV